MSFVGCVLPSLCLSLSIEPVVLSFRFSRRTPYGGGLRAEPPGCPQAGSIIWVQPVDSLRGGHRVKPPGCPQASRCSLVFLAICAEKDWRDWVVAERSAKRHMRPVGYTSGHHHLIPWGCTICLSMADVLKGRPNPPLPTIEIEGFLSFGRDVIGSL